MPDASIWTFTHIVDQQMPSACLGGFPMPKVKLVQTFWKRRSRSKVLVTARFRDAFVYLAEEGESNGRPPQAGGPQASPGCQPFRPTKRVGKENTTNLLLSDMLFVVRSKSVARDSVFAIFCAHTGVNIA